MTPSQATPAWFDKFWGENCIKLPPWFRGEAIKLLAWQLFELLLDNISKFAKTPDGVRQAVAFARIASIVKGSQNVLDAPDPTPEQVAEAVQRLVDRSKA